MRCGFLKSRSRTWLADVPVSFLPSDELRIADSSTTEPLRLMNCGRQRRAGERQDRAREGEKRRGGRSTRLQGVEAAAQVALGRVDEQRQVLALG